MTRDEMIRYLKIIAKELEETGMFYVPKILRDMSSILDDEVEQQSGESKGAVLDRPEDRLSGKDNRKKNIC